MQTIVSIQNSIQQLVKTFDGAESTVNISTQATRENTSKIFSVMRKVSEPRWTPLHLVLVHLTDQELLTVASTCRTLRKLVFSPFGYKLLKSLRPLVVEVHRVEEEPVITISMYEMESRGEALTGDEDEDDLQAAVMVMSTNILATMHKIKQLEVAKKRLQTKTRAMVQTLNEQSKMKELLDHKNTERLYKIQKEQHMGQDCERHIEELVLSQQQKTQQKQERVESLRRDRDKLLSQKQLLIKKLKSVMAEVEQEKTMSLEVSNIMDKLEHILKKK